MNHGSLNKIKHLLLANLIGIVTIKESVSYIGELISNDYWHNSFTDLVSDGFYVKENLLCILRTESYKLSNEDFKLFELKLYPFLLAQNTKNNWQEIEQMLYNYIKLKVELLNLSGNDSNEYWYSIINDYELRNENMSGILNMPEDLTDILLSLNSKIWDSSFCENLKR